MITMTTTTTLKNKWFDEQNISSTHVYHTFKYISFPLEFNARRHAYVCDEN